MIDNIIAGIIFALCMLALGLTEDPRELPDGTIADVVEESSHG